MDIGMDIGMDTHGQHGHLLAAGYFFWKADPVSAELG